MAAIGVFPEAARGSAAAAFSRFRFFVCGALRRHGEGECCMMSAAEPTRRPMQPRKFIDYHLAALEANEARHKRHAGDPRGLGRFSGSDSPPLRYWTLGAPQSLCRASRRGRSCWATSRRQSAGHRGHYRARLPARARPSSASTPTCAIRSPTRCYARIGFTPVRPRTIRGPASPKL
jgi:hypothetical protein